MPKKEPLYPHIPKSQTLPKTLAVRLRAIYCYIPTKANMIGMMCFYAKSREEADEKAQAVDYYDLEFSGTWDEIGERIKREGQKNWLGEVGY